MLRIKNKPQSVAAIEADLVKQVRTLGRISRVDLARELKIAPSTASIYVDRLTREGFLVDSPNTRRSFGRPPTLLALNPEGGRFVGVDFEARNLMAAAVDFSQKPLRRVHKTLRPTDSADQLLDKIERAIQEVMADDPRRVLGIGLGVPGAIDPVEGVALRYEFIKGWQDIPLGARLRKKFGAPVFLENNVRCMALAELWFGGGRGLKDFVCLGVRSGIAAGVVVNGQLLRGASNRAGEIGHWSAPVPPALARAATLGTKGDCPCRPGLWLEQVASLSALLQSLQRARSNRQKTSLPAANAELAMEDLAQALRNGDVLARSLLQAVARVQGWVVWQLCALFDPQKIILAGPLAELDGAFLASVREAAAQWGGTKLDVEIACSSLGKYNGALGAAALALHQWKPKR